MMVGWFGWKRILIALGLAIVALYPVVIGNSYIMHVFIVFFLWTIVAACWDLMMGYAGIYSLGNVAFFMSGAYAAGILSKLMGWSPWLAIFVGGLSSAILVTIFVGLPSLRLSGIYIAVLSLIFASALPAVLTSTQAFTGGASGLVDIPPLFPGITRFHSYYINFALFLVMLTVIYFIIRSSTGLAFVALRDSSDFAKALGVNEYREKIKVFAICSFLTGIAGGFYAHYLGDISPATLAIGPFLLAIAMMEVGGMGRFPGAVMGSALMVFGNEFLRAAVVLRFTILGGLICMIILFFPGGLMQFIDWIDILIASVLRHK